MDIVPAVDIRGGHCVNLVQGDYDQETVFSENPVSQAALWWEALQEGLIHIVDLDGARKGRCCVEDELRELTAAGIPYEVGGGIRNMNTIETLINAGAERVILGTAAHRTPDLLREASSVWPGRIVVGIDARAGKVSLSGWMEDTSTDAVDFAKAVEASGASRIIYTDILSDGMMKGPNYEATAEVAEAVSIPVTISGGISSLDDIRNARELEALGIDEIIIGRSLYLRQFTVQEAVQAAKGLL